jgi:hypothetical protein
MRFYDLEEEFKQVSTQIAKTLTLLELAKLYEHRSEILVEARQIVHELDIPEPVWCWENS